MNNVNIYCIMTLHFFSYKPCNLIRGITMRYIGIVLAALLPLAGCSSTPSTVNAAPKADKVEVTAPAAAPMAAPVDATPAAPMAAPDAPAYTEDKPVKAKKKKGKKKLKGKKGKKHAKHGKKVKKAAAAAPAAK